MIPATLGVKLTGLRSLKLVLRKLPDGLDMAEANVLLRNDEGYRAVMREFAKSLIVAAQAAANLADMDADEMMTLIREVKIPEE